MKPHEAVNLLASRIKGSISEKRSSPTGHQGISNDRETVSMLEEPMQKKRRLVGSNCNWSTESSDISTSSLYNAKNNYDLWTTDMIGDSHDDYEENNNIENIKNLDNSYQSLSPNHEVSLFTTDFDYSQSFAQPFY
jgi:hypothetical protein